MKMYLGACVVLTWAALALLVWTWVRAATRRDDDEPDVQPVDPYTFRLSESRWDGAPASITYTSGGWRN